MPAADTKDTGTEQEQGVIGDAELERQVKARRAKREEREQEGDEPRSRPELIQAAAKGEKLSPEEIVDATEWLLTDTPLEDFTHELRINVGSARTEKWIDWLIRPVDLDTLRRIRKAAQGQTRAAQRRAQTTGELDEVEANVRIVVEGTVEPNLRDVANQLQLVDPADVLRKNFAHKPGLLGQIAGEIMGISGYDDEDVREVDAAKNS